MNWSTLPRTSFFTHPNPPFLFPRITEESSCHGANTSSSLRAYSCSLKKKNKNKTPNDLSHWKLGFLLFTGKHNCSSSTLDTRHSQCLCLEEASLCCWMFQFRITLASPQLYGEAILSSPLESILLSSADDRKEEGVGVEAGTGRNPGCLMEMAPLWKSAMISARQNSVRQKVFPAFPLPYLLLSHACHTDQSSG